MKSTRRAGGPSALSFIVRIIFSLHDRLHDCMAPTRSWVCLLACSFALELRGKGYICHQIICDNSMDVHPRFQSVMSKGR